MPATPEYFKLVNATGTSNICDYFRYSPTHLVEMLHFYLLIAFSLAFARAQTSSAPTCSTTLTPKNAAPSVASGWDARVVATGLTNPRGIIFDSSGHLLVVQQGKGIGSLSLTDNGGACVIAGHPSDVILDGTVSKLYGLKPHIKGTTDFQFPSLTMALSFPAMEKHYMPLLLRPSILGPTTPHQAKTRPLLANWLVA